MIKGVVVQLFGVQSVNIIRCMPSRTGNIFRVNVRTQTYPRTLAPKAWHLLQPTFFSCSIVINRYLVAWIGHYCKSSACLFSNSPSVCGAGLPSPPEPATQCRQSATTFDVKKSSQSIRYSKFRSNRQEWSMYEHRFSPLTWAAFAVMTTAASNMQKTKVLVGMDHKIMNFCSHERMVAELVVVV